MIGLQRLAGAEAGILAGRGMRVLLLDQDAQSCARVIAAIDQDSGFVLAGNCREWPACEVLLDRFVPELLIASTRHLPPHFLGNLSGLEFPVVVGLRTEDDGIGLCGGVYDSIVVPAELPHICRMLDRVRYEVYRRKAAELSTLFQRYMESATKGGQYLAKFRVEDQDQILEIEIEDVLFVAADGNYIRIHTNSKTYEIRETMNRISAKLDPSRFARAHRSYIVNLTHVQDVVTKEGSPTFVRLSNGIEVPVGPNYRDVFDGTVHLRTRLTA
jgi:two-component system LytT family response regulator